MASELSSSNRRNRISHEGLLSYIFTVKIILIVMDISVLPLVLRGERKVFCIQLGFLISCFRKQFRLVRDVSVFNIDVFLALAAVEEM